MGRTELVYPKVGDVVYDRLTGIPRQIVAIEDNWFFTVGTELLVSRDDAIWYIQKVG